MRKTLLIGLALPFAYGCSSATGEGSSTSTAPASPGAGETALMRHRIVRTWPDATCTYLGAPKGDALPTHYANDDGVVNLWYAVGSPTQAEVSLECSTTDGRHDIFQAEAAPPVVPVAQRKMLPGHTVRPALTAVEMTTLTAEELTSRGYPPRPDVNSKGKYATWSRSVSSPIELIARPQQLAQIPPICIYPFAPEPPASSRGENDSADAFPVPARRSRETASLASGDPILNPVWSGIMLQRAEGYSVADGTLHIPSVVSAPGACPGGALSCEDAAGSLWIGLGGGNGNDAIVQGGVDVRSTKAQFGGATWFTDVHLVPFWQYYTSSPGCAHIIYNVTVNVGDSIYVVASGAQGGTSSIYLENQTTSQASYNEWATGWTFTGATAEWIIENPPVHARPLFNYGITSITDTWALCRDGFWDNLTSDPGNTAEFMMVNGSDSPLSYSWESNATTASFWWIAAE